MHCHGIHLKKLSYRNIMQESTVVFQDYNIFKMKNEIISKDLELFTFLCLLSNSCTLKLFCFSNFLRKMHDPRETRNLLSK